MNGVFQSLRGEFELEEMYTGSAVLGVLVNTIKVSRFTVHICTRPNILTFYIEKQNILERILYF